MEAVICFYSVGWYLIFLLSLIVLVISATIWIREKRDSGIVALVAGSLFLLTLAASGFNPPQTNVVQLAPGEELVGSYQTPNSWASVVVRRENGEFSVRDIILPTGEELEIRTSSRIDK